MASVFLCLLDTDKNWAEGTIERATNVLNNVIYVYRFTTLDPLVREINGTRDTYCTLVSLARVPADWPQQTPGELLGRVGELDFGSTIGEDRIHRVGANSYDDLFSGGQLANEHLALFRRLADEPHEPDIYHVFVFSALRRLKRFEWALAVLDAQSAFEVLVAVILRKAMSVGNTAVKGIDALLLPGGRLDTLQRRLTEIDRLAAAEATANGEPVRRFLGSDAEREWRRKPLPCPPSCRP